MLRFLVALSLLAVPTFAVAQQKPQSKPLCLPADTMLNTFLEKGFKVGGIGDLQDGAGKKVVMLYQIQEEKLASVLLTETPDGKAVSCLMYLMENFNTKFKGK